MKDFFKPQRVRLGESYADRFGPDKEFIFKSFPYQSRAQIFFQVTDPDATPSPGVAYATARAGQQIHWFTFGINDPIAKGPVNQAATPADTNMSDGNKTNGAEDYVIEGISVALKGVRLQVAGGVPAGGPVDPDVVNMFAGLNPFWDPAGIVTPPQVHSPFNLEQGLWQAVAPYLDVELVFDRSNHTPVGTADLFPCANASSYLRANGEPTARNYWRCDEGYLWRRDGQPDSDLDVVGVLREPVTVPINTGLFHTDAGPIVVPTGFWLDVGMRLHGVTFKLPSQN